MFTPNPFERLALFEHIRAEAARDNIYFALTMIKGDTHFTVGKYDYKSIERAFEAVKAIQRTLADTGEERFS